MRTSMVDIYSLAQRLGLRLGALVFVLLTSCAAATETTGAQGMGSDERVDTQNCTLQEGPEPGGGPDTGRVICIVFSDIDPDPAPEAYTAGCPTNTVYWGLPNGTPSLPSSGSGPSKLVWQAVKSLPDGTYESIGDVEYRIVFDPFVGKPLKSHASKGWLKSGKLDCSNLSGASNSCIPGVEYKYTILKWSDSGPDPSCAPLDPVFRINY